MSLQEKVRAVEEVFASLDQDIRNLQSWSGLHCKIGCGKCCFKADIEATVLEFLPFAHDLYVDNLAFDWLVKLKDNGSPICLILNPTQAGVGLCSEYKNRGLICRLFGFSARTNKYGKKELVTCQVIKTEQQAEFEDAASKLENKEVPMMQQYYWKLQAIDHELAHQFYPINEAIKKAIETVLAYYAYRN